MTSFILWDVRNAAIILLKPPSDFDDGTGNTVKVHPLVFLTCDLSPFATSKPDNCGHNAHMPRGRPSLIIKSTQSHLETPYQQATTMTTAKKSQKMKFKKAPGAPKRFKSAYMFFSENMHKVIRLQENRKVSDFLPLDFPHSLCHVSSNCRTSYLTSNAPILLFWPLDPSCWSC